MRARYRAAAIGAVCAALALNGAASALADDTTTTVPAPPPAPNGIGNALGQAGATGTGLFGLPDLSAAWPTVLLGQAVPESPGLARLPSLSAADPNYLLQQNESPAAPGEGSPAPGIAPNTEIPGNGRIALLRRLYAMYSDGQLRGALLGQQSPEEFAADLQELQQQD